MTEHTTHHMGTGLASPCGLEPASVYRGFQGGFTTDWADVDCPACLAKAPEGVGKPTPLQDFYFTFGVQYSHEPHPHWAGAHPDGWLTVVAADEDAARLLVRRYIGNVYAFSYTADRFKREYHPLGELGRITADGSDRDDLVPVFGPSDPEYYGRRSDEVVAHRIEGVLALDSDADAIANLGYEAETFHKGCADEGRVMFKSISEEDPRVLAFELDWADPHECPVCGVSIT